MQKKNSQQTIISAIVAMAENRVIGYQNKLPWHLPADLKHFKSITMHHPIIMGRKTFASIGKPLPGRTNIIISRDKHFSALGCEVVNSLDDAIKLAKTVDENEIFIIGGAQIFEQSLALCQRIYLTIVQAAFVGDVYFPVLPTADWLEISNEFHEADENNAYDYLFLVLERKKEI